MESAPQGSTLQNLSQEIDFKPENTVCVVQHEYAVTQKGSAKPILGTFGASPCVILAIYDEQNKIALLAHIDAGTNLDSLQKTLAKMSIQHSVAYIYGGNKEDPLEFDEVIAFVKKNQIEIKSQALTSTSEPASFAINADTGKIYLPVEAHHLDVNATVKKKIQEYDSKSAERQQEMEVNSRKFIGTHKHLWHDKERMNAEMKKVLYYPLDEGYNGLSIKQKYFSYFTSLWEKKPASQDKKNADSITKSYKK